MMNMKHGAMTLVRLCQALVCLGSAGVAAAQGQSGHPCDSLNHLNVGDPAPDFRVMDNTGRTLDLDTLTASGPVVLVFYRGAWCPYCNKHMSHLQDSLQLLLDRKATVIAVSPEVPESAEDIVRKSGATFSVVHDAGYAVMCAYGTAYFMDAKKKKRLRLVGINVDEANGNADGVLPIPATFVIGTDGRIAALHFEEDHKERMSVKAILEALPR